MNFPPMKPPLDDIERTEWFDGTIEPTIPGMYAAKTGGGHVFSRKWDGSNWRSSVNGEITNVQMPWRGIVPGSIALNEYDFVTRTILMGE